MFEPRYRFLGFVFIFSLTFFNSFTKVSGIDCWVCTSDHSACGETIDETSLQDDRLTQSGCAGCGKTFSALGTVFSKVERTCLTVASDTCDNKLGYGSCTCSTTYCNAANHTHLSLISIFFILIAILKCLNVPI